MGRWFICIVAFLIYAAIAEYVYLCPITGVICPTEEKAVEVLEEEEEVVALSPIMFNWNDPSVVMTDGFDEAYRNRILSDNSSDKILEITGFYSPAEVNNTDEENLGRARAKAIADLFPNIPRERIIFLARRVDEPSSDPNHLLDFSELQWVDRPDEDAPVEEAKVVTLSDREIAYFPFSSANPIVPEELETYLQNLANNLKVSNEQVVLTGHTDNIGSPENNQALGLSRANSILQALINYGVPANQIKVQSRGEMEPTATNETEQGRARNRRVEIVYKK